MRPMRIVLILASIVATLLIVACGASSTPAETKVSVKGGAYTNVTPATLKQMLSAKDFVFINVHIPYEGEIANTDAFIPYDTVEANLSKFPSDKNAKIFLYCRSGHMSSIAAEKLVELGYINVWNLDGGMIEWENARLPLIRK
jgi:rhodanese-related sulfurtransferase